MSDGRALLRARQFFGPRDRHGGRGAWLVGIVPGAIALAFLAIVLVVLLLLS